MFFRTAIAEYRYIFHVQQDFVVYERLDRIKLAIGRRSALFVGNGNEVSETLPLLSYLGITYKKNEVISDVIEWFEESIDFQIMEIRDRNCEQP